MRGVTSDFDDEIAARKFQPALPMRGVTEWDAMHAVDGYISTRTPHAGSDGCYSRSALLIVSFQPALPMRGVTWRRLRRR